MDQEKSKVGMIALAVVIAAIVIGGGVYAWRQQSSPANPDSKNNSTAQIDTPQTSGRESEPNTQKSLKEYFVTREQFLNSEMPKDDSGMNKTPEVLGFKELATIEVTCSESAGTPCEGNLLILSKDLLHSGNQEFYLAFTMGTGYTYYGPFTGNLQKIVNESKSIGSLKK